MRIISTWRNAGIALALFTAVVAGCSGTEKSICDKGRQCLGGNDADYNACVQNYIYEGKIASDYKCSDAWSNYLTCLDSTSTCDSITVLGVTTKRLKNSCDAQASALDSCEKAASTKGSEHFLTTEPASSTAK
ncbi:MAG TPA: hypothetical protein PKL17_16925 [Pseudomonadota bacterium]|jgi:hypothetical protein|nr:hypothetical protein [Pseudomonadota bacterium]HND08922.1 hypothetical protein [Pseudomonadota bacterium]HNK46468.1 hypothetical protein [Pseudomonadota bacterium]HNN53787.1 hypothetical protein [Pseudomonadota bacterium]